MKWIIWNWPYTIHTAHNLLNINDENEPKPFLSPETWSSFKWLLHLCVFFLFLLFSGKMKLQTWPAVKWQYIPINLHFRYLKLSLINKIIVIIIIGALPCGKVMPILIIWLPMDFIFYTILINIISISLSSFFLSQKPTDNTFGCDIKIDVDWCNRTSQPMPLQTIKW